MSKKKPAARSRTRAGSTRRTRGATTAAAPRAAKASVAHADDENDIDACELDFTKGDLTSDADLPPATGGVASTGRRTRRT